MADRPRAKRSGKRRLVLGGLLVVVALFGLGLFPQKPVQRFGESRLRASLGPKARLTSLRIVPVLLRGDVEGLHLEGAGWSLDLPKARVRLTPRTLFGGTLGFSEVTLDAPRLRVSPTFATSETTTAPGGKLPSLAVTHLAIRGAEVIYDDPSGPATLHGLDVVGAIGDAVLDARLRSFEWRRPQVVTAGPAEARFAVSPKLDVTVESFEIQAGPSRASASGDLLQRAAFAPDLRLRGRVDLASVLRPWSDSSPPHGLADVQLRIRAVDRGLLLEAKAESERISAASVDLTRLDASATYQTAGGGRGDLRLSTHALGGRIDAEAHLINSTLRARARLTDGRLEHVPGAPSGWRGVLAGEAGIEGDARRALTLATRLEAAATSRESTIRLRADASGPLRHDLGSHSWVSDLAWKVHVDARRGNTAAASLDTAGIVAGPFPPRAEGRIDGGLVFAVAGERRERADVRGSFESQLGQSSDGLGLTAMLEAAMLGGTARLDLALGAGQIQRFDLHGERLDLSRLHPAASGGVRLDAGGHGALNHPFLSVRALVDDLNWQSVRIGDVALDVQGDGSSATWSLRANAASVDGTGMLLTAPQARVQGTVWLNQTPLDSLSSLLPADHPAAGRLLGSVEFDVPFDRPATGRIDASVRSLEARSGAFAFTTTPFTLTLADSRLHVGDVHIAGSGLDFSAQGEVGLAADAPVELHAQLKAHLPALPVPEGWSLAGSVESNVTLTGTPAMPRLDGALRTFGVSVTAPGAPAVTLDNTVWLLDGDRVRLSETVARLLGGTVTLSGMVPLASAVPGLRGGPLRPEQETDLRVSWRDIDAPAAGGTLAGEASVTGGLAGLAEVRAQVSMPATALRPADVALELEPVSLRLERGVLTAENLALRDEAGRFQVGGSIDLLTRALGLTGRGSLELRALSPFLADAALSGTSELDLMLGGTLDAPRPQGTVSVRDGTLRLRDLPQALTAIEGSVRFDGHAATVQATSQLGGGPVHIDGTLAFTGTGLGNVQLTLSGRDLALSYPAGLRTRLDSDLTFSGRPGAFRLQGDVHVLRGLYDLDLALEQSLLKPVVRAVESPTLRAIALEIRVGIDNPVLVRNNLVRLQASGKLTARGDMQEPTPFGRLEVQTGGKVYLQGREFTVTSGSLTYSGTWDPTITLAAETSIPTETLEYHVTVRADGSLEEPRLGFTSDPELPEAEIASLVATGRLGRGVVDTGSWLVGGQAAAMLAGRLTRGLAATFGLDEITVRPDLLAREADPGARVTFGKQIGRHFNLLYSAGLGGPESRFFQLEARPAWSFTLKLQRADDNTYTYGVGQRFRFGRTTESRPRVEQKASVTAVQFEGDLPEAAESLRSALHTRPGRRVTTWDLQEDADRLRSRLREADYLEAEVGARLEKGVAVFRVRSGPRYAWRVTGLADPPDLARSIRSALFEEEALAKGRDRLLRHLRGSGHPNAQVSERAVTEGERRMLVFQATPGRTVDLISVRFPGASALSRRELLRVAGGAANLLADPEIAVQALRDAYHDRHFLTAAVELPRVRETAREIEVEVPIREGPQARIADVRLDGISLRTEELLAVARLRPGQFFDEDAAAAAALRVRDHYLTLGFPSVRVRPVIERQNQNLVVVLHVAEGQRLTIGEVRVAGNTRTRESLIRRQLGLSPGEPLDPRKLAQAERRLLDLGTFSRASLRFSPENPSTVTAEVVEDARLTSAYDLRYSDADRASALVETEWRNLFGTGLALGGLYRVGSKLEDARGSLHLPALVRGADLTGTVFHLKEDFDLTGLTAKRIQTGFQVQQAFRLPDRWSLLLGYRYRRTRTVAENLPDVPLQVAGAELSLLRDSRDNLLDPKRGRFWSLNLELAPSALGSDAPFVKGFAQALFARPLGDSLTWAHAYRLGLASGLQGQPVITFERFRAGGGNSVRGFGVESLGPRDAFGDPSGGEAVVILNQELRYRHRSGLGFALFWDAGNVFPSVREMTLDVRHAAGAGLRWSSPVGLLRLDVGFPLDRKEGERRYRFFFSLGQAF